MKAKLGGVKRVWLHLVVKSRIVILCVLVWQVTSCEKIAPAIKSPSSSYPGGDYNEIFESFWNGMNTNYVFWNVDTVDWDQKYRHYKPLFADMSALSTANDAIAEGYFLAMTANLIDSHYTLNFVRTGNQINPAYNRKVKIHQAFPDSIYSLPTSFFTSTIPTQYFDAGSKKAGIDTIIENTTKFPYTVVTGTINNDILYLWMNGFFISQASTNVTPILDDFFERIQKKPINLKGIIIDVRTNNGGEVLDLDLLIGRMISAPLHFGYTRQKSNIGRLDYTPIAPAIINPQPGATAITIPIVALADHFSISLAEVTALAINTLPNGKSIGTTTWGANGPLAPAADYNAGQFTIGDDKGYMSVYTSSSEFTGLNGTLFEGKGIPPGKWVLETSTAYGDNVDLQLAAALTYINSH